MYLVFTNQKPFSNGNAIYREYDAVLNREVTIPSSSFFPNLSYKIEF